MTDIPYCIYIDEAARHYPLTQHMCDLFPHCPQHIVQDTKTFLREFNEVRHAITEGKKSFFLTVNKGTFVKKCPGTKNYLCCGYQILHSSSQCSLDCTYCILQSYFNNPLITFFVNTNDLFCELDTKLDKDKNRLWRIGTGEFTDSLVFDDITDFSSMLIPYFIKKENAILELKTKTVQIDRLLEHDPRGKIVLGWSLNAKNITKNEEHGAASISKRLDAAKRCAQHGYKIAFHFDPIFYFSGWEKGYKEAIDMIFTRLDPVHIAWISLGCFRFIPSLKKIIETRFPQTDYTYDEFITGLDGKMRYPKTVRIDIYRKMHSWLKSHNDNLFIYLCMESAEVWKKAFGYTPRIFGSLANGLDAQVFSSTVSASKQLH